MSNIDRLRALLEERPAAAQALIAKAKTPETAKAALLGFGSKNGIAITEAELARAMAQSQAGADGTLSEAELAQVAGGRVDDAVLYSIFTFGIGCAVVSADAARAGKDCRKEIENIEFPRPGPGMPEE